jgi:signal transduction histidine kinase
MMFRGALMRLAAQYFVLLVLILGCFDFIVYFTVSQALQARIDSDSASSLKLAYADLTVTGDTITANPQGLGDPSLADTFVRVQTTTTKQVVLPGPANLVSVFSSPLLEGPAAAARNGQSSATQVATPKDLFLVATRPITNAKKPPKVIGILQVAQPISWVNDALSRLVRQLVLASVVGIILGALASLLMATRSLRPIGRAFQRQREFVADASHELRTPLTLIRTNVEAWLRRASGANRVYARNVVEEVEQLNRIVGDLTTLALADARQLRIERQPIELNEVVRDLMTQTEPLAEARGVQIQPELNGGARVDADLGRVRQLLLILIDNALTHTPSGGRVSVGVVRENGHARVTVADNGEGIPAADLPHIFERFYRADKARTRENGGSGLGLAIAKWIVDAHKGVIEVKSEEGHGTEVAVSLPAID